MGNMTHDVRDLLTRMAALEARVADLEEPPEAPDGMVWSARQGYPIFREEEIDTQGNIE